MCENRTFIKDLRQPPDFVRNDSKKKDLSLRGIRQPPEENLMKI